MANKLEQLLEQYQGNAYPAMVEHFAAHLHVSADSLTRLEIGWAPIVPFKKGPNFQGWWVIPERDAAGEPTALGLRSQSDMKVMYPGSKHGLIYEVNPAHERGSLSYKHGAHNWMRTMDAGVDCPVCHKPDGCLISSDDPADPRAVICIRVKAGAVRPMKFGYLHLLKEEGHIHKGASALCTSDLPVLVVEGMTDTAAAMDMGFVAVGRPSNLACMGVLSDLVRGRNVLVVGENDDINPLTGERPGHEGMVAAFQILKKVCPEVRMVLPPEHFKDLRQWKVAQSLTATTLLEYVELNGKEHSDNTVLPDSKPLTIASAWLHSEHRMAGRFTLRFHKNQWFRYIGTKYTEASDETDIRGPLYGWCDNKMVLNQTPKGEQSLTPLVCHKGLVNNVMDAMLHPCPLDCEETPGWINGATGPNPNDIIPFTNGLLWVPKYLEGADESEYLLDLTPDFFTTFCLPFPFDPTLPAPEFKKYLRTTLGDDMEKIRALREWYGYCMSSDTSLHKMMLFRGPKRSGKSTAVAVLQAIVGRDQCSSVSFAQLTERFGLEGLVGKQLAVMGDARLPRSGDSMRALELLLNIVGEDPVNVDRKFMKPLANHYLKCRFTLASNELPELPDHSGALEARLNILDFKHTFLGREDFGLRDKLIAEAPGIAVWALEGLRRLRKRGRFFLPESSQEALREWRTTTSPTAAFLEECCDEGDASTHEVLKTELFDAWNGWSKERGMRPLTKSRFFERVKSNAPYALSETYEKSGFKYSVYRGLRLKRWAAKQFTGRPN